MTVHGDTHPSVHSESTRTHPPSVHSDPGRDGSGLIGTGRSISRSTNLTPLPSKRPSPCNQGSTTYAEYLDSMLSDLRRVHRGACVAYYSRRLNEMGIGS